MRLVRRQAGGRQDAARARARGRLAACALPRRAGCGTRGRADQHGRRRRERRPLRARHCGGGAGAARLAEPAVANGGVAIATVLIAPGDETAVARVRGLTLQGEVGASAWNGIAAVRLCAADAAALRRDLVHVMTALRGALPRLWTN